MSHMAPGSVMPEFKQRKPLKVDIRSALCACIVTAVATNHFFGGPSTVVTPAASVQTVPAVVTPAPQVVTEVPK